VTRNDEGWTAQNAVPFHFLCSSRRGERIDVMARTWADRSTCVYRLVIGRLRCRASAITTSGDSPDSQARAKKLWRLNAQRSVLSAFHEMTGDVSQDGNDGAALKLTLEIDGVEVAW
jgi:hypothetical protein